MIQRRTEIKRTPLKPGAGLQRSGPIARKPAAARAKPRPARVKDTGPSPAIRAAVKSRDGHRCVRCGACIVGRPHNIHHRLGRGMGGSGDPAANLPSNLIVLCGSATTGCHGWATGRPAEAGKDGRGWVVQRGMVPAAVPVLVAGRGLVYLSVDAEYLDALP